MMSFKEYSTSFLQHDFGRRFIEVRYKKIEHFHKFCEVSGYPALERHQEIKTERISSVVLLTGDVMAMVDKALDDREVIFNEMGNRMAEISERFKQFFIPQSS